MADQFDPYHQWLSIPPEEQPPNHYRLLGLKAFENNRSVIENASDRQMKHVRSCQAGKNADASQKLLNEISQATVVLLNAERRAAYDAELRTRLAPRPTIETPAAPGPNGGMSPGVIYGIGGAAAFVLAIAVIWMAKRSPQQDVAASDPAEAATGIDTPAPAPPVPTPAPPVITAEPSVPNTPSTESTPTEPAPAQSTPAEPATEEPSAPPPADLKWGIFLDDLTETAIVKGVGELGKRGARGYGSEEDAAYHGAKLDHALSMHPPANGVCSITYQLDGKYRAFAAVAGQWGPANSKYTSRTPLRFSVIGDGKTLWTSRPIGHHGGGQEVAFSIEGVRTLTLQIACPGANNQAWGVWIRPQVSE